MKRDDITYVWMPYGRLFYMQILNQFWIPLGFRFWVQCMYCFFTARENFCVGLLCLLIVMLILIDM